MGAPNVETACLRLFKALPIMSRKTDRLLDPELASRSIQNGFIFAPEVSAAYSSPVLVGMINDLYGRNPEELNATFHKSFAKVRDASILQLVFEQAVHYLTTYGAEAFGCYDKDSVFIPREQLDAPQLQDDIRLVVIRGLTKPELKAELLRLTSGIALAEQTVLDVVAVATFVGFTEADLATVRNKEVRAALYDNLGIVPSNPEELLRFIVFKATGKSLLIKSNDAVVALKGRDNSDLEKYFAKADLAGLSSIFYRYKPLFLALRTTPALRKAVNRIRKGAPANHRPMPEDLLNSLTSRIKNKVPTSIGELDDALNEANTFRKVRLAYALKFRASNQESILYRVRNGKSFATSFSFDNQSTAHAAFEVVMDSIAADLHDTVAGKKIFIPAGLNYALPATEKQFTGNLPTGSYAEVTNNLVVGVHWDNVPEMRVDLDLSMSNAQGKIGWDGYYRDRGNGIYFSGDITDAPHGATEVFHVGAQARGSWLMNLNFYNYREGVEVPFKIVAAQDDQRNVNANYTIDPNKVVALSNSAIGVKQKTLGVIISDGTSSRFYFAEAEFQRAVSARHNNAAEHARNYLVNYYTDTISFNEVLENAGAQFVGSAGEADIDLSWEAIDRATIIDLLNPARQLIKI